MILRINCLILLAVFFAVPCGAEGGYGRSGVLAQPEFRDTGNFHEPFSVTVDSASAVQVYDSFFTGYTDRSVMIQNTSETFNVYCGTHPDVMGDSGPRWTISNSPDQFITNGIYDIYCIADPIVDSAQIELLGVINYDTKD